MEAAAEQWLERWERNTSAWVDDRAPRPVSLAIYWGLMFPFWFCVAFGVTLVVVPIYSYRWHLLGGGVLYLIYHIVGPRTFGIWAFIFILFALGTTDGGGGEGGGGNGGGRNRFTKYYKWHTWHSA